MDKLIEQIAELTKLSTDTIKQIIENYPAIRTEYAWYQALNNLVDTLETPIFILSLIGVVLLIVCAMVEGVKYGEYYYETGSASKIVWKFAKWPTIALVVCLGLSVVARVATPIVAPDISLIMQLLNK